MRHTPLLLLALVGCKSDETSAPKRKPAPVETKLAGVWPERFKCDSIATTEALSQILGQVRQMDNPSSVPRGVAHPCNYEVTRDGQLEYWMFDFDCRDGMKQRADALFEQYKKQNADQIAKWDELADAGAMKPNDAGIEYVRPGEATEVQVGAKGLDHHGQGILFIDDDAPCYVRVSGKDAALRLELARLVAKNLTFENAPMTPRPLQ